MNSGDVLLQWQDESGAWQRGYPVQFEGGQTRWLTDLVNIVNATPFDIEAHKAAKPGSHFKWPIETKLLVMPLYSKRPVAVWVEIGKLTVVPDRTD